MRFLIFAAALLLAASARAQTTLSASPAVVAAGGSLTATWAGIASPTATDWIAMYVPGAPNGSYLAWRYTTGAASGSVPFTVPSSITPGTYQLRLFANNGYTVLATSNNFTVAARTIAGTVTLNGSALAGVSFAATNGGTCTASDASGNYVCGVSQGWSGSITPSLAAHGFTPASRSYTNVISNQTAQNYTAIAPLELSGTVTLGGSPLTGVTLTPSAGGFCTQTNASGQYTCAVPQGWTGNVTPSLANHIFTPASRSYASLSANQTAQDYAATVLRHVSGTARVNGLPVANVAFAASSAGSCTPSNSAGQYDCAVPDGWTGSVTPSHMGYSFTPVSRSYTSLAADDPAEDYTATPSSPTSNISFIHVDHLNTPRLLTNDQGQTVWRWDQAEPFGVNVADENPSGLGVYEMPLRFPGQYFDKETNLHYNYFRDYDSGIGRYVQSDPIGLGGGPNTYLYALSPLLEIDPEGLMGNAPGKGPYAPGTGLGISPMQIIQNIASAFSTSGDLVVRPYCNGRWVFIRFTRDLLSRHTLNCTCWWSCYSCPPGGDVFPDPNLGQYTSPGKLLYSGTAVDMKKAVSKGDVCQCPKPGPEKECCK